MFKPAARLIAILCVICTTNAHAQKLTLELFVSNPEEVNVTSALIMGPKELLVVCAQGTRSAAQRLADQIERTGRKLKYVYLTHPHLDHSQGARVLAERFPDASFIATPEVAKLQTESIEFHDGLAAFRFGANASIPSVPFSAYLEPTIVIDGEVIEIWKGIIGDAGLEGPHTALYIPSLHTLLPSDTVYFDAHVMMAGSTAASRALSIQQIDRWLERDFDQVIPGHMPKGSPLTAEGALQHTRSYVQTYDTVMAQSTSSDEVIEKMIAHYPELKHRSALYLGTYINFDEMDRAQQYLGIWRQENPQPIQDNGTSHASPAPSP